MFNISIKQWPQSIEVKKGYILDAALKAGVPFPHSCAVGECGKCKSHLMEGNVIHDAYSMDALTPEDRNQGMVLACRARATSDISLRWISEEVLLLPVTKFQTKVTDIEYVAHDVVVVRMAIVQNEKFHFYPGQFAKLSFGKLPARSYSMASQPEDHVIEFHIRQVPGGVVSDYVANTLRVGDLVGLQGPFGESFWQTNESPTYQGPLLLLAGGTGMAPILSVLDAALKAGTPPHQIHVYHGVRGERDLYAHSHMAHRIRKHHFCFTPVYSKERVAQSPQGFLHEVVGQHFSDLQHARIFVAGPPPMVDAVIGLATERGTPKQQIKADAFYAAVPGKLDIWKRTSSWLGKMAGKDTKPC
jgi:naphthalene 1,2-dioxygenase ferredoxin reductase component